MSVSDSTVWIDMQVLRGPKYSKYGFVLNLKAHPAVEDFSKQKSSGLTISTADYSDLWLNVTNPEGRILVYSYDTGAMAGQHTLDYVGSPMFIAKPARARLENGLPGEVDLGRVNLSVLKLVGISNPEGVTIGFGGAYSLPYLRALKQEFTQAARAFLLEYITPVDLNVQIISR